MADATARDALPKYAHRFSPKRFAQHQLFAYLLLKEFLKTDYRGVVGILADCPDLCAAIELPHVPHSTMLQKAADRLPQESRKPAPGSNVNLQPRATIPLLECEDGGICAVGFVPVCHSACRHGRLQNFNRSSTPRCVASLTKRWRGSSTSLAPKPSPRPRRR